PPHEPSPSNPGTIVRSRCAPPAGGVRDRSTFESGTFRRMEQRVSLVTLGVADVGRSRSFYEQLGWRGQEADETVFFQGVGQGLVLWGRDKLAADAGIDDDG